MPIPPELAPWLAARKHERWVFPTDRGKRRYSEFPKRRFRQVVQAAKLEGGPHKLRHTFATHFLASEPDIYLLAQILGHSHTVTTALYGHLLQSHLARARGAVKLLPAMGAARMKANERWGK